MNSLRSKLREIQEQEITISHQAKIINRLMPTHPCQMIVVGIEVGCMKPSTHVYGGVQICKDCTRKLIDGGANPQPVRFNFEKQQAYAEIA